jgi:hypothetical protein
VDGHASFLSFQCAYATVGMKKVLGTIPEIMKKKKEFGRASAAAASLWGRLRGNSRRG